MDNQECNLLKKFLWVNSGFLCRNLRACLNVYWVCRCVGDDVAERVALMLDRAMSCSVRLRY